MKPKREPAIARLVSRHGGPTELARKLGGTPAYQEIQRWLKRGWASPMHVLRLEPLLLPGMELRDLYLDRERVAASRKKSAPSVARDRQPATAGS